MEIVTPEKQTESHDYARYGRKLQLYGILWQQGGKKRSTSKLFEQIPSTWNLVEYHQAMEDLVGDGKVVLDTFINKVFLY